ncbi:hypothetical protein AJ80_06047 [Polytolypa hystricis UAMH7299]|uniref:C6 finger domain transcription factor nscR n=1 Tax=Polytolypa hystricis (strain UAMH7299) TaxID=1447883 RepID=A0A2B7Y039_POLH7|nr:hypothetical protein AJ80_06047 [Polytolypa hystricis UAMH7299]
MLRKNGRPTSCEPCRISKVRCDHTTPICGRCEARGLSSNCYYHPAPLTRPRGSNTPRSTRNRKASRRADSDHQGSVRQESTPISPATTDGGTVNSTIQNSYLGSTSFLSVFSESFRGVSTPSSSMRPIERKKGSENGLSMVPRLSQLISGIKLFEELINGFYEQGQLRAIPGPLVLIPLRLARTYLASLGRLSKLEREELCGKITKNMTVPLQPPSNITFENFCSLYTGENLRWEFIGVIFALAGVAALWPEARCHSPLRLDDGNELHLETFAAEMAAASEDCMTMCKQYEVINDLMVWLCYAHWVLSSDVLGETSHQVYRQFGDVVANIYAMGLHRYRPPESEVSFFLSETRKRVFATAYRSDKNVATFLGRPPQLPYHYCDATLPLDIDDVALTYTGEPLKVELEKLGPDGWHTEVTSNGKLRAGAIIRLQHRTSRLRENVLRLSLGRKTENFANEVSATYQECKETWAKIPARFRYNSDSWKALDPMSCTAGLMIYLEYLHAVFQVERIRSREGLGDKKDLLDCSMQAVSAVMDFSKQQTKAYRASIACIFLFYTFSAAGVLAIELHACTVSNIPMPSSYPRSEIIRSLTVLISWFESDDIPGAAYKECVPISKVISKLLDDTLNHQHKSSSGKLDENAETNGRQPAQDGRDLAAGHIQYATSSQMEYPTATVANNGHPLGEFTFDTSENFLSWLDELGMDAGVPDLLL